MALALAHQTLAEFGARFFARLSKVFSRGDKLEFVRMLWWLEQRIVAGDITDAQARTAFNSAYGRSLNAAQWTTLRTTRIQPAATRWAQILAETDL